MIVQPLLDNITNFYSSLKELDSKLRDDEVRQKFTLKTSKPFQDQLLVLERRTRGCDDINVRVRSLITSMNGIINMLNKKGGR